MSICKELIDVAVDAGCDAVKFQKRDIDKVYTQEFLDSSRESPWGRTQREQKEGLEFNVDQYKEIDSYCKEKKIEWFASAWDLNSQEFLRKFNCNYNKVASAMIVYEDLLLTHQDLYCLSDLHRNAFRFHDRIFLILSLFYGLYSKQCCRYHNILEN